jgi:histidyl-tRNA synthetase
MPAPQVLPGFREFAPADLLLRQHIFRLWRGAAHAFGFQEYDTPVLEPLELFTLKSGPEIEDQLFAFTDKGGRGVALRPEMTPAVCRMVGERAGSLKRPIKWCSIGEQYRYERKQRGRLRAFFQFNADIFDEPGPEAETELIALLVRCLGAFGLTAEDFCVRLSDRSVWWHFLRARGVAEEQVPAVLGVIDKLEREPREAAAAKLDAALGAGSGTSLLAACDQLLAVRDLPALEALAGSLPEAAGLQERLTAWRTLLAGLSAMGLGPFIQVDLSIVRGLAYYTGFVFEAFDRKGEFRAIAGGGRYDNLVEKLGGPRLPACGFAIGDVVLAELLKERGRLPALSSHPDVYVIICDAAQRAPAFAAIQSLRETGTAVEYALRETGVGKQFKNAGASGARLALIFGGDEAARGVVKLRDLRDGAETDVPAEHLTAAVRDTLSS